MGLMDTLTGLLSSKSSGGPRSDANTPSARNLGDGMAAQAAGKLKSRKAYNDYVIDESSKGNSPLSFEEWMKS